MKKFILLLLFCSLNATTNVFFMPDDAKNAQKKLLSVLNNAQKTIDVAIYSFTHKQIAKALKKAAKRGVRVRIITNYKDANKRNRIGYVAKYKNVHAYLLKGLRARSGKYNGKMHLKVAIVDNKILLHGSANWSFSAFGLNYETFIVDDDEEIVRKFSKNYEKLIQRSQKF